MTYGAGPRKRLAPAGDAEEIGVGSPRGPRSPTRRRADGRSRPAVTDIPDIARLAGRRCVVLGAGGFIGTNLTAALNDAGARVVGFGRGRPVLSRMAADWITRDFVGRSDLAGVLCEGDVVFHLMGGSNPVASNRAPAAEIRAALDAGLDLVEAAVAARVARLVFVSSGGTVYGPRDDVPIREDTSTDPISAYGVGKLAIEKLLGLFRLTTGLDHVILRVANPYGPHQLPNRPQGVIATMMQRSLTGAPIEIWGDGSVVRDYLYVDDLCDALLRAAVVDAPTRVFNIGSGVGRSLRLVAEDVARVVGRASPIVYRDARPADIPINVLDIGRAGTQLGWHPRVDWDEGLARTAAWMASNGAAR